MKKKTGVITPKLSKEITNTLRVYNRRITQTKEGKAPDRITRKQLEEIKSREELRQTLRALKRYRPEKATLLEENTELSQYEFENLRIMQRNAKIRLSKRLRSLEETPMRIAGKQIETYKEANTKEYREAKAAREELEKIDVKKLKGKELEQFKKIVKRYSNKTDKNNRAFMSSVYEILEKMLPENAYNTIKYKLDQLTPAKFARLMHDEEYFKDILESYDKLRRAKGKERDILLERIDEDAQIIYRNIDIIIADYV